MNVKGMSNPTMMYVEIGTGKVLGPSIPTKASGKPGWQGRPAFVEKINGEWREIKNAVEAKQIARARQKAMLAEDVETYNRPPGRYN